MSLTSPPETEEASPPRSVSGMTTKPPSGSGLAADSDGSIDDAIGDLLLEAADKPIANPLTIPAPGSVAGQAPPSVSTKTPPPSPPPLSVPISLETPPPLFGGASPPTTMPA